MINPSLEVEEVVKRLHEKELYIHSVIELAFTIKQLVDNQSIDFSSLISPSGGSDWENLAMMLPYLPRNLVIAHLDQLLEGFMDLNWPGTGILYGFLSEMDIDPLHASFSRVLKKAIDLDDTEWVWFLLVFMKDDRVNLKAHFSMEIEQSHGYLISRGVDFE